MRRRVCGEFEESSKKVSHGDGGNRESGKRVRPGRQSRWRLRDGALRSGWRPDETQANSGIIQLGESEPASQGLRSLGCFCGRLDSRTVSYPGNRILARRGSRNCSVGVVHAAALLPARRVCRSQYLLDGRCTTRCFGSGASNRGQLYVLTGDLAKVFWANCPTVGNRQSVAPGEWAVATRRDREAFRPRSGVR